MQSVNLAELAHGVQLDFISNPKLLAEFSVTSISTDTRSLKRDDLFIAIEGEARDGHDFISKAILKKAKGIIFESGKISSVRRNFQDSPEVLFVGSPDTRKLLGTIARNYLKRFRIKKIAITGSAGKTTTKTLISSVLSQRYRVVSSIQSYNNDIGVPKTILNIDDKTDVLVQELGTNHPGEIAYLSGIVKPDCALITNIGPAHIGFFGSEEDIAREKKTVFSELAGGGTAFLNADDRYYEYLKKGLHADVRSFGLKKGDLFPEEIVRFGIEGSEFILNGERIVSSFPGVHGILNATASALVGKQFGLSMKEIKRGIENCRGEAGRGTIFRENGITLIDETYNANPLSVAASLDYIGKCETAGRRIFIFGDMLELGEKSDAYHKSVAAQIMNARIEVLFTFGEKAYITGETCKAEGHPCVYQFNDVQSLAARLKETMKKGDLILFKGSRAIKLERAVRELVR